MKQGKNFQLLNFFGKNKLLWPNFANKMNDDWCQKWHFVCTNGLYGELIWAPTDLRCFRIILCVTDHETMTCLRLVVPHIGAFAYESAAALSQHPPSSVVGHTLMNCPLRRIVTSLCSIVAGHSLCLFIHQH